MRVVRFLDDDGVVRFGCAPAADYSDVALCAGTLPGAIETQGRRVRVFKLLCPVDPRAILCIGLNYRQHAAETGAQLPDRPVLFMKNPAAAHHPGAPIRLPTCSTGPEVDYEVELGVVIAKAARDVPQRQALDYVLGYTVGNDVSARRWQTHGGAGQWVRGKSFDTFCPFGPCLVTPEQIPDPQALKLTTHVNGEVRQESNTADMIFPVARLIAEISRDMTLLPGTLLLTGTPEGVGVAREPKVFLENGDEVRCGIEGIGELTNRVEQSL